MLETKSKILLMLIQALPLLFPIIAVIIFGFLFKGIYKYKKYAENIDKRVREFKDRTFSSYEEESRAKQQLRQELLTEISRNDIPKQQKKFLEGMIYKI